MVKSADQGAVLSGRLDAELPADDPGAIAHEVDAEAAAGAFRFGDAAAVIADAQDQVPQFFLQPDLDMARLAVLDGVLQDILSDSLEVSDHHRIRQLDRWLHGVAGVRPGALTDVGGQLRARGSQPFRIDPDWRQTGSQGPSLGEDLLPLGDQPANPLPLFRAPRDGEAALDTVGQHGQTGQLLAQCARGCRAQSAPARRC